MEHEMTLALIESSQPSNDSPVLPNVKNSRGKKRDVKQDVPKKPKASWDDFRVHTFISICVEEVENGNKPSSTLNKVGYENLERKVQGENRLSLQSSTTEEPMGFLEEGLAKLEGAWPTNRPGLVY